MATTISSSDPIEMMGCHSAPPGRPIELRLLPSGIRGDGDQDQVGVIGCRADVQGVGALQAMVDEFPVLSLVSTAIGASGSGHVHGLRSRCTQADTVNVIVRARQLLPAGTAIAGAHHASLNPGIQAARIVWSHAQVAYVRMPGLGVEKPLLRLWYSPKANTFFPAPPPSREQKTVAGSLPTYTVWAS